MYARLTRHASRTIHHLLGEIPYEEVQRPLADLPERVRHPDYVRHEVPPEMFVPDYFRPPEEY